MFTVMAIKRAILNLRLKPEVRNEFAIVAELRGATMSGLLHQFIVRSIREEKELSSHAFKSNGHHETSATPVRGAKTVEVKTKQANADDKKQDTKRSNNNVQRSRSGRGK